MNDQARKALVEIVATYGPQLFGEEWRKCQGLLQDKCRRAGREINALVTAAREAQVLKSDPAVAVKGHINRVAELLFKKFGIDHALALWAAETWALALGDISEFELSFPFSCPKCASETRGASHWRGRVVVCPACKSQIAVAENGGASILSAPSSTVVPSRVNWWMVVDEEQPDSIHGIRLAEAIQRVLANDSLTPHEKANQLDFQRTLAVLPDIAADLLEISGPKLSNCEPLILGILRGAGEEAGLTIEPNVPVKKADRLRRIVSMPLAENILAVIDGQLFEPDESGVIFGAERVYFRNPPISSRPGSASVPYAEFPRREFSSHSLQELQLGRGDILDLRGTGISKRAMLGILKSIKHVLVSIGWEETDSHSS